MKKGSLGAHPLEQFCFTNVLQMWHARITLFFFFFLHALASRMNTLNAGVKQTKKSSESPYPYNEEKEKKKDGERET